MPIKKKQGKKKGISPSIKKFVKDWIKYYEEELCITEYNGDISYMADDKEGELSSGRGLVGADVTIDHKYLRADYRIYPQFIKIYKRDKEEAKEIIAHEVAHLATHKLHWIATCVYIDEGELNDAWESLTEKIGRLINKIGELKKKKT